jgi:hypothetical protein
MHNVLHGMYVQVKKNKNENNNNSESKSAVSGERVQTHCSNHVLAMLSPKT